MNNNKIDMYVKLVRTNFWIINIWTNVFNVYSLQATLLQFTSIDETVFHTSRFKIHMKKQIKVLYF